MKDDDDIESPLAETFDKELFGRRYDILPLDILNPAKVAYAQYRTTMSKLNNQIYKKIVKPGRGPEIDLERLDIIYDYSMFLEFDEIPFDSSFLNKQSGTVSVKNGLEPQPGCYLALASMKLGEEAQFLISSELMYGKIGKFR